MSLCLLGKFGKEYRPQRSLAPDRVSCELIEWLIYKQLYQAAVADLLEINQINLSVSLIVKTLARITHCIALPAAGSG